jgi:GMP synthase (glutamine-hydrolysing)
MAHVLLILHRPTSHPGLIGARLQAQGHALTCCRPLDGDRLPEAEAFDATVIFGGPQGANDPCPYLATETRWIERALVRRQRLLGVCLGAQLMAKALGTRVGPDPAGRIECGYTTVDPGEDASWVPEARSVYHWHRDGFDLPASTTLIARGRGAFPIQGFALDRSLGLQFHPEVDEAIMAHWMARDHGDMARHGASPAEQHWTAHAQHAAANAAWLDGTLARWLTLA